MKCKKCNKDIKIPDYVFNNVERYGNISLTISECCNAAFTVKAKITFSIEEYDGTKDKDHWGEKINNKIK